MAKIKILKMSRKNDRIWRYLRDEDFDEEYAKLEAYQKLSSLLSR